MHTCGDHSTANACFVWGARGSTVDVVVWQAQHRPCEHAHVMHACCSSGKQMRVGNVCRAAHPMSRSLHSPPKMEVRRRIKVDLPQPESAATPMTTGFTSMAGATWREETRRDDWTSEAGGAKAATAESRARHVNACILSEIESGKLSEILIPIVQDRRALSQVPLRPKAL